MSASLSGGQPRGRSLKAGPTAGAPAAASGYPSLPAFTDVADVTTLPASPTQVRTDLLPDGGTI